MYICGVDPRYRFQSNKKEIQSNVLFMIWVGGGGDKGTSKIMQLAKPVVYDDGTKLYCSEGLTVSLTCTVQCQFVLTGFAGVRRLGTTGFDGRARGVTSAESAQNTVDGEFVMGFGARFVFYATSAAGRFGLPRRRLDRGVVVATSNRCRIRRLSVNTTGRSCPVRVRGRVHRPRQWPPFTANGGVSRIMCSSRPENRARSIRNVFALFERAVGCSTRKPI